jgi:hypothetical protein
MISARFRILYIIVGFGGLIFLIYYVALTLPDTDPLDVLYITVPDILFFFLAYKTYPQPEIEIRRRRTIG